MAVSGLGNADHLTLFLLKQAGADAGKVQFATMGVNLLEALRQGQVDAGLVQEPALTLLARSGARVLVNGMDLADAKKHLGGTYEFMGLSVRGKELAQRKPEMAQLTKALADALKTLHTMSGDQLVAALPKEMTTGLDLKQFGEIPRPLSRLALPRSPDHRSRRRQARGPEPDRRRPAQARCRHFRSARHHDRGQLAHAFHSGKKAQRLAAERAGHRRSNRCASPT